MTPSRLFAVIPCAGIGARSGAPLPKQYRTVAGHNLLHHTLTAFDACSELTQTLVVLAPHDTHFDPRRFGMLEGIGERFPANPGIGVQIGRKALANGLLCRFDPHWLAFGPALIVTGEQLDEMLAVLDKSIEEVLG